MAKRSTSSAASKAMPDAQVRICVIYGQEEMLKRQRLEALRDALTAEHHEVETITFDGKSAALATVFDELRSYGLMQQYKIVLVDDADVFVSQHREAIQRYAANPVDHGTLVLRSVKWNAGNLDKAVKQVGFILKCDAMSSGDATTWLVQRMKDNHQQAIEPSAASLLVQRTGSDLMRLEAEAVKLSLMVEDQSPITRQLVEQVVGRGSDEDAWMVQEAALKALASHRGGPLLEKIHELVALAGQPPELVSYFLADLIRKLYLARHMLHQGQSEVSIGKAMKLWGPRQAVFMTTLRRLEDQKVAHWLDQIVELDHRSKTGRGDALGNLQLFAGGIA